MDKFEKVYMDKFEKVYKELMDRAMKEQERIAPIPATKNYDEVRELARIAAQTQNQRVAGALRRTEARVKKLNNEVEKELLDAYDAERD